MKFSILTPLPPIFVYHFVCVWGGQNLVWPMATNVHRFKPISHSNFYFYMDPPTNDGGLQCYLPLSKIGPICACAGEDLAGFRLAHVN